MEFHYDDDDLMTQNHNWSGNWTDFNQEVQQRQGKDCESCASVSFVEDRIMASNLIHGCNIRYNYFVSQNQILGRTRTRFNQRKKQKCANLQGGVSTSSALGSSSTVQHIRTDNQNQNDDRSINHEQQICDHLQRGVSTSSVLGSSPTVQDTRTTDYQNQDDDESINQEEKQICDNLQDVSNSFAFVTPPTVEDARTPDNENQEGNKNFLQEQHISGNIQGGEDDFIPLSTEYIVEEYNIYVGGISNDTNEQKLKDYFTKFGEVKRVFVKRCRTIGKPWNFAFVTFPSEASVNSAMAYTPHIIDGQKILVGRTSQRKLPAFPRVVSLKKARMFIGMRTRRIHVGGIKYTLTDAEILYYFEKFGKVERFDHPVDQKTRRPKNFCLVTFENEATVQQVCRKFIHKIGGQNCRVKRAKDRLDLKRRTPSRSMDCSEKAVQLHGKAINRNGVTDGQSTGGSIKSPMHAVADIERGPGELSAKNEV